MGTLDLVLYIAAMASAATRAPLARMRVLSTLTYTPGGRPVRLARHYLGTQMLAPSPFQTKESGLGET